MPLATVDTSHKTIQDQGVQSTNDTLHFRVIGNQKITRMLRVRHFQVKVITITMEYPIGLLCGQSRGIDTECTDHTFQLFHSVVLQGCRKRAKQRCNLSVRFQHLKD